MRGLLYAIFLLWGICLPLSVTGQDLSGNVLSITQPGCSPPLTGEVTVLGIDGSPPYVYTLDASIIQTNGTFSNLILGDHSIVIKDELGNTFTLYFSIEINNQLEISVLDLSHVACAGQINGQITVGALSGVSPFIFSINGGVDFQSNGTFNDLSNGIYEIIGQDGSGCFDTVYAEILALSQINILAINQENVECFGGGNGSVQLIGEFGSSPYQYSMDGGSFQANEVFSNIDVGDHQFWVEDINGCTDSISLNFTQPDSITIDNLSIIDNNCFNSNDGELSFEVNGGSAPYYYQLNGGLESSTPYFNNLNAEEYILTIVDANSCAYNSNLTIDEPDSIIINIDNFTLPLCYGAANGSIEISCSGGTGPYEYKIVGNPWQATGVFSAITSGTYTLKVRDQNACTNTLEFTLLNQSELILSLVNLTDVLCDISTNGSIEVLANGGVGSYSYSLNNGPFQSSSQFNGLSSGLYTIEAMDDNSCITSIDLEIVETNDLQIDDVIIVNAVCGAVPDGQLTVMASGGSPPYQYSLDSGANQASNVFLNVTLGIHTIILSSTDGCSVSSDVLLSITSDVNATVVTLIEPTCAGSNDGSIEISASGGSGPYNYSIDFGANWQGSGIFSGLTDSSYFFSIIDQNFCTFDTLITFTQQSDLYIEFVSSTSIICPGSNDGTIVINGQNGTLPYSYSDDGVNFNAITTYSGLGTGDQEYWLQDGLGCIVDTIFSIDAYNAPSIDVDSLLAPTCNGMSDGVIQVSPGGNATPYQYSIDANPLQPSGYFNNLSAGTYSITVQDNNLCQTSTNLTLADVPLFQVNIDSIQDILCKGEENGVIFFSFSGGQSPYYYRINSGAWLVATSSTGSLFAGNYNIDFKDENGCIVSFSETINEPLNDLLPQISSVVNVNCLSDSNGSVIGNASGGTSPYQFSIDNVNYQSSGIFNNLWVDNYTLSVIDANGCMSSEDFSVVSTSSISLFWTSVVPPSCEVATNGSLSIAVVNGADPYSFVLNSGTPQTGGSFPNLGEGYYLIEVTDDLGCSASIDTVLINNGTLEIAVDSVQNITCLADSSGEIYLTASGGTPGYLFFIDGLPLSGNNSDGFTSGIYQSWVVDAAGCTDSIEVAVLQESLLQGSIFSQQNILCNNGDLGSVTVNGITGSSPYFYSFEGGAFDTINTFIDLEAGNYTVIIQDATDCEAVVDINIELLTQIDLQVQYTIEPSCNGLDDAIASFDISGGIGPYQYSLDLSTLLPISLYNGLYAGLHSVYAEDSQGCNDSLSFFIDEPLAIDLIVDSIGLASCFGNDDAFIDVSSINSIGMPEFTLQPGNSTNVTGSFTNLLDGVYTIVVIDQNQCTKDSIIEIISPSALEITTSIVNPLDCFGDNNAIVNIGVIGGIAPFEYFIDSVSNGNNNLINNLTIGDYSIQVIDQNNCAAIDSFSIDQPDSLEINTIQVNNIICYADDNGTAFFMASGGSGNLDYQLNASIYSSSGLFTDLTPGDYTLQVLDSLFCSIEYEFSISEPPLLEIDSIITQNAICNGDSNASILVYMNGGIPDYSYFIPGIGTFSDSLFENISAGAYYVSVSDQNGCNTAQISIIDEPLLLSLGTQAIVPPLCYDDSSATVLLQAIGGNGSSMYGLDVDDLALTSVFHDLFPGMTTFYVVDSLGCSDSLAVFIPNTDSLNFGPIVQTVSCNGESDGTILLNASGGSQSYSYSMDQTNWLDTGAFSNLIANDYLFYLMDSNGCLKDTTITIEQPDSLLALVASIYPVTCSDQYSGVINLSIIGGTEPFESTMNNNTLMGSYVSFDGLSVDSYQISIIDSNGCTTILDTALNEVEIVNAYIEPTTLDCYGDDDGMATVIYSGGSGSYSFLWDNITQDETASTQSNLLAGVSYSVSVFDSLDINCFTTVEIVLTQPAQIEFELYPFSSSCDPNEIWVNVELITGGVEPFLYSINDGVPVESSIFEELNTVSTQFKVIDADGCFEDSWITPENPNVIDAYFEVSDDVVPMGESEVVFTDLSENSSFLEWEFGNGIVVSGNFGELAIADFTTGNISQPEHTYKSFGEFTARLNTMSEFGCEDSYEKLITVEEDHRVYVPNSFTPNSDGINDIFEVKGSTIADEGFSMRIFDRSGSVVFESFDINLGWDGTGKNNVLLRPDVFVFMITYYSGEKLHEKNGLVTLVR